MNSDYMSEHADRLRAQMALQRVELITRNPPIVLSTTELQKRRRASPGSLGLAAILVCIAMMGPRAMLATSIRTGFNAWIRSATRQLFPRG